MTCCIKKGNRDSQGAKFYMPPYNTGCCFVYDDDFVKMRSMYDAESGEYNEEGSRLVANTEGNGRFHSG